MGQRANGGEGQERVECRAREGDSHLVRERGFSLRLGHVTEDEVWFQRAAQTPTRADSSHVFFAYSVVHVRSLDLGFPSNGV